MLPQSAISTVRWTMMGGTAACSAAWLAPAVAANAPKIMPVISAA
nr:MAG TPA: hypothetical protein [Caudoviricetes sp.]